MCLRNGETCWEWTVKPFKPETKKEGIQASYDDKPGTAPGDHGRGIGQARRGAEMRVRVARPGSALPSLWIGYWRRAELPLDPIGTDPC
jgi:hypothetical protein